MDDDHYCPSPDEIQEACRRIRAAWSPDERRARRLFSPSELSAMVGELHEYEIPPTRI